MNGTPVKESEERLLSALLFDSESAASRIGHLTPEMFSVQKYGNIYKSIMEMIDAGELVDYITLSDKLGWIKPSALVDMVDRFIYTTNFVQIDVGIITNEYRKRRLKEKLRDITDSADSSEDMLALLQDELDQLHDFGGPADDSLQSQTTAWLDEMTEALDNGGSTGLQTGYGAYDAMTGGLKKNHLVVLAARPKVGKTTLGLNMAYKLAKSGIETAVISLEMGSDELTTKLAGIDSNLSGLNFLNEEKILRAAKAKEKIDKLPLHIVDNSGYDYRTILNKCRQLIRKHNVKAIFIDYLQLMTGDYNNNRNNEIAQITRAIKQFNMRYRVPIVLLSQLNRKSEIENREPIMSDLRDSGAVEQDANVVVFVHPEQDDMLKIIVAGCRGGSTGFFGARFDKPISRIDAIDNRR